MGVCGLGGRSDGGGAGRRKKGRLTERQEDELMMQSAQQYRSGAMAGHGGPAPVIKNVAMSQGNQISTSSATNMKQQMSAQNLHAVANNSEQHSQAQE